MLKKNRLFTPGPTPLLPAAQLAMAAANVHHRTADFKALFLRVLAELKVFIGTANDVILLASSGTGAMEASVANLTKAGDKVLVLTAGKFGERWTGLAKTYGCAIELVESPYGQTFSLEAIKAKLTKDVRCVYVQANESSTGVRHDIKAIAASSTNSTPRAAMPCWSSMPSPDWAPQRLISTPGASMSSSAARRRH